MKGVEMLYGMDISELLRIAGDMVRAATKLREMIAELTQEIESAPWQGADRERFIEKWRTSHMVSLNQAADEIDEACSNVRTRAKMQERVSA